MTIYSEIIVEISQQVNRASSTIIVSYGPALEYCGEFVLPTDTPTV